MHHEAQTSAAHEKRHESSRIHCALDDSAASPKRLEMSGLSVDTSAAERLEKSSLATVDDSAAGDSRWSRELADGTPVGQRISHAIGGELGDGTYRPECWSTPLAAHTAPTSVITDELVTAISSVAPNLAAGVDTGPSRTEGACNIDNSGEMEFNQNFCMVDWNDLLETKDQLGPIPSFWNNPITGADSQNFELPILKFGSSLTDDIVKCLQRQGLESFVSVLSDCAEELDSDLESSTTSEMLTSDGDPVIFCGMGRIARDQSESSDPEPPKRRNRSSKPSGHSRRGAVHHKPKKNRVNSSSYGCKVNVNSFKWESSEIPEGGGFRARTVAPSSDSSSSSSESSESSSEWSSSEDEKESRSRRKLGVSRGVKIKAPFTFDGRADLDVLDQWTYEVDTWREWNGISDQMTVKIIVNFMSGKASRFFMKHVALRQKDWTVKSVYEGLFNYCFPPDFKLQMHEQLTCARQGTKDVRDFHRNIETLAVRFPDVTERQLRQIFWDGIRTYLRLHLIEKGLSPEHSSLARLVKYTSRREAAHSVWKREQAGRHHGDERSINAQSSRATGGEYSSDDADVGQSEPECEGQQSDTRSGETEESVGESTEEDAQAHTNTDSIEKPRNRVLLPRDEYERLKHEGRCFKCKVRGHLSRDCTGEEDEETVESNAVNVDETSSEEMSESEAETLSSADDEGVTVAEAVDWEGQETESEETCSEGNSSEESYRSYEYPNEGLSDLSEEC
jgi:hypothetical protein